MSIILKGHLPGYKLDLSTEERRKVLRRNVKTKTYNKVIKKVNALSILLRNRSPVKSKRAEADKNWLKRTFGSGSKRKSKKLLKRQSRRKSRKSKRKSKLQSKRKSKKKSKRRSRRKSR